MYGTQEVWLQLLQSANTKADPEVRTSSEYQLVFTKNQGYY